MIGPWSYSLSTKWTVQPCPLLPYVEHRLMDVGRTSLAAERGDQRRMDIHHAISKSGGISTCLEIPPITT